VDRSEDADWGAVGACTGWDMRSVRVCWGDIESRADISFAMSDRSIAWATGTERFAAMIARFSYSVDCGEE
jgi:hypothetical protein